ncbi:MULTISPECIES: hypothetical protein [unclassified Meridianimarinicoccus]|nr:hypothetical protein [Fluviibacterium sp. MJW13]
MPLPEIDALGQSVLDAGAIGARLTGGDLNASRFDLTVLEQDA